MINLNKIKTLTPCFDTDTFSEKLKSKAEFLKEYALLQFEYSLSVFTQDIDKVARLTSNDPELFNAFRSQPIYMLVSETMRVLLMSLVEALVFSEILLGNYKNNCNLSADVFFIYLGYSVKKFFGKDMGVILGYLKTKFYNFEENFLNWETRFGLVLDLSVKQVNKLFKNFKRGCCELNYNCYVDRVLQISTPYQIESKEAMKSILSDLGDKKKVENRCYENVYGKMAIVFRKYGLVSGDVSSETNSQKDAFLLEVSMKF